MVNTQSQSVYDSPNCTNAEASWAEPRPSDHQRWVGAWTNFVLPENPAPLLVVLPRVGLPQVVLLPSQGPQGRLGGGCRTNKTIGGEWRRGPSRWSRDLHSNSLLITILSQRRRLRFRFISSQLYTTFRAVGGGAGETVVAGPAGAAEVDGEGMLQQPRRPPVDQLVHPRPRHTRATGERGGGVGRRRKVNREKNSHPLSNFQPNDREMRCLRGGLKPVWGTAFYGSVPTQRKVVT